MPIISNGDQFGRLTVVALERPAVYASSKMRRWRVRCECGTERVVFGRNLRHGDTRSCGCLRREVTHERFVRHGESHRTALYTTWKKVKQRCYDPNAHNYHWYGERGIGIAAEWRDNYPAFAIWMREHLGERPVGHSLDRIDNGGNYVPGNLRWATQHEQRLNQRPAVRKGA